MNTDLIASGRTGVAVLALVLLSVSTAWSQPATGGVWKQPEFVLGTFWDPPLHFRERSASTDSVAWSVARDAGFNLMTGTQGEGGIDHSFGGMKWALTIARKVGLRYLVSDNRYFEAYRQPFNPGIGRALTSDYRGLDSSLRSTLYGYTLCDEPRFLQEDFRNVAAWKQHFDHADPGKLGYINLVASYAADQNWGGFTGGNNDGVLDDIERRNYEQYLAQYIDSIRPAVASFDHYPFFKDGRIRRDYFYNLNVVRKMAGDRPVWTYPMTVGHLDYVDPQDPHLLFMYFCPLAYGVKGLVVFTYWTPPYEGFRTGLFDRKGEKTSRFSTVRRLNAFVSNVIAPVIMGSKYLGTYHVSDFPDGQRFLGDTISVATPWLAGCSDRKVLFGLYQDRTYLSIIVVNKALIPLSDVVVTLKGVASRVSFSPRVVGFDESSPLGIREAATTMDAAQKTSEFRIPEMQGGEGRLVRIRLRDFSQR